MKSIINKKVYDTETADLVAEYSNGLGSGDFNYLFEALYITKKGTFFLYGSGGAFTKYSDSNGRETWGTREIAPMTEDEAYGWLEENNKSKAIEQYFSNKIEEA